MNSTYLQFLIAKCSLDQSDAVKFLPVYFMKQNDLGKKQIDLGRKQIDCRKQTDLGWKQIDLGWNS